MEKVNIGIIGCGYWGRKLLRVANEIEFLNVLKVVDVRREIFEELKGIYKTVEFSTCIGDILESEEIEGVIIATPTKEHYRICKRALEKGKDCFVEKPFTMSSKEGEELVKIAEEKSCILMVGHTYLYSQPVRKIKQLIEGGKIGEVMYITSKRINLGIHRYDVDVIWDLAPHDLSIIYYWLELEPIEIKGFTKSIGIENHPDVAFFTLKFPHNILANVEISWVAPVKIRQMMIVGSEKMIIYQDTNPSEPVKVYEKSIKKNFKEEQWYLTYRSGPTYSPYIPPKEPLKEEIKEFGNCIITRKKPISDGRFGVVIMKMMEMIREKTRK